MTSSYVLNRICGDVVKEMASKPKGENEIDWTVDTEVLFFYSLLGHKPVGVNRHFMMMLIQNKFSTFLKREISSKVLWDHLDTMYDMSALNESEIIPFPNHEVDFELPEDCHDLLYSKYGVILEKANSEIEINKDSASSSKSSKKLTPKLKQSNMPVSNSKTNFASSALKSSKSHTSTKIDIKNSDAIPKVRQEAGSSVKSSKVKHSSSPFSNKAAKSEFSSVTPKESSDILSTKKSSKIERGSSPAIQKKPVKVEPPVTYHSSKKSVKGESSINGSKLVKSEAAGDGSVKKVKPEKEREQVSKKGKSSSSSDSSTKKPKADGNYVKKKSEHESCSKKSAESSGKSMKADIKNSSHSSKGHETETSPHSGSRKLSGVKVKTNESSKKLREPREEVLRKSISTPKRKRL